MSTSRIAPDSIIGRLKALDVAKTKKDGIALPAVNILSDATSERLDLGYAAYKAGVDSVEANNAAYHIAIRLSKPQRILLKKYINSFYNSLNNEIKIGLMLDAVRAYYGLNISNRKMPLMNTDTELLAAAAKVLSGDILRRAAGGPAIASPTIAQFTSIYNTAKPVILSISNTKTLCNTAVANLEKQIPEIKDLITHIWDEAEAYYSLDTPANRRAECRLWGVRYRSTGVLSLVTGTVKDELGVAMAGVKVRILGSSISTLSDALGNFSLNTSLYGDLEIEATHINYEKNITDFVKEDGVAMAVGVVMIHL